jgi:hypothetical protein
LKGLLLLSGWIWTVLLACTHQAPRSVSELPASSSPRLPVTTERMKSESPLVPVQDVESPLVPVQDVESPLVPVKDVEAPLPDAPLVDCVPLEPGVRLPYYMHKPPVIVIGFLKPCTTDIGEAGYQRGSSWTAMGVPCTQGRGRIDRRGNDSNPNIISFLIQTSCPMAPSSTEEVDRAVRERLQLGDNSKLIAYYPLSIDYWEFVQYPERDTGFSPQLFTPSGINQGWQRFLTKGEPLRIKLYGRENAWERGRVLFEVEADIIFESRSFFRLQITQARGLSNEQKDEVRTRCETLRPKRNCSQIFD